MAPLKETIHETWESIGQNIVKRPWGGEQEPLGWTRLLVPQSAYPFRMYPVDADLCTSLMSHIGQPKHGWFFSAPYAHLKPRLHLLWISNSMGANMRDEKGNKLSPTTVQEDNRNTKMTVRRDFVDPRGSSTILHRSIITSNPINYIVQVHSADHALQLNRTSTQWPAPYK